jgi:hypothetical protein
MSTETTEKIDYSQTFRETKGTKTIKVTKDVYMSLLYCKGMNIKESMTKTIANLIRDFQFDCVIERCDVGVDEPGYAFILKSTSGRERKLPTFSDERVIIRVAVDLHKALTDLRCHPEESINMIIFRLLCSHYRNRALYRIFTEEGCLSCDSLIRNVEEIWKKNRMFAENICVEIVNVNNFLAVAKAHKAVSAPLSILFDVNGKEVWSASGHHDPDDVQKELEKIAMKSQPFKESK